VAVFIQRYIDRECHQKERERERGGWVRNTRRVQAKSMCPHGRWGREIREERYTIITLILILVLLMDRHHYKPQQSAPQEAAAVVK
jgi:hypothetical protein